MRLIDAIQTVIKMSRSITPLIQMGANPIQVYNEALQVVEDAPTVGAVEVVRCRDCKYRVLDWQIKSYYCCHPNGLCGEMDGTRYCDCGDRKDGDGNG